MSAAQDDVEAAAETLHRYLRHQTYRTFTPGRLYGVFRGDVLVTWGVGRNALQWANRQAGNCWDGELRVQYLGRH